MRWWIEKAVGVICTLAVAAAVWAQRADEYQTVQGFRVPTYDDEGNMTSQLFGEFAKILPDGLVEITELRVEIYKRGETTNRVTEMRVTSPHCRYHRARGTVESEDTIRIARDNMVVTGKGFSWNNTDEVMKIKKDAKVVLMDLKRQMEKGGNP